MDSLEKRERGRRSLVMENSSLPVYNMQQDVILILKDCSAKICRTSIRYKYSKPVYVIYKRKIKLTKGRADKAKENRKEKALCFYPKTTTWV